VSFKNASSLIFLNFIFVSCVQTVVCCDGITKLLSCMEAGDANRSQKKNDVRKARSSEIVFLLLSL
jgi:hypothetical protein